MSKTVKVFDFDEDASGVSFVVVRQPIASSALSAAEVDIELAQLKADLDAVARRMKAALVKRASRPLFGDDHANRT
jgi:hypothetical protein